MSEQKLFKVEANAEFYADNITHALIKLGKYLLSLGKEKEKQTFETIFVDGSINIQPVKEKENEL